MTSSTTSVAAPTPGRVAVHTPTLTAGTLVATALAVLVAQVGLAIPAVLNGLFQQDLHTTSSQLTWISDAFLVPVALLELSFGVLGDIFGRKKLLIGGSVLMAAGELVSVLAPAAGASNHASIGVLWSGQALTGIGAAVLFPTTLAMVAAGTHTARSRARGIAVWAAALSSGGFVSPLIGGAVTKLHWGADPTASWRWAFVVVGILAVVSVVAGFAASNSSAPEGRSLDWPGQATLAISLFALLFSVIQGATSGWGSTQVIAGWVVAVVLFAAFIVVERRSTAPLLRLDLFRSRAFSVNSIVTLIGMFSFLGTAYATSIRLSAIQGFSPMKTSIAFVLLQGFALLLMPLTAKVIRSFNPRWALGCGFLLIGVGDLWISTESVSGMSLGAIVAPLVLVGIGFAFALSSVTAVAVNTVSSDLHGMAAGTTSQLRDFGFTLGPAVIGAIALSRAATEIHTKLATNPALQSALAKFSSSAPPPAVGAVHSGPLGANAVPGNPLQHTAFTALGNAYSLGYVVCGVAALAAAALAVTALGGTSHRPMIIESSLDA
ncbi:MFS transporter [Acidiferrimicrobium sp. IK]|uniref:MFS transporter n=1 Tax=Acidiferrimicrobium sp. IK TaxID=2871700 RepID=UPI0021CB47B1|nr:MFS transporter [Acidiferrimicrobium sp. IK]MCU4186740.1 MFS transporter [Acidiferrimicrobium sp. IK]